MRPLKLIMRAFGPYAGEQEIDFTKLGERTMFLIHGPTGAGKTTILDGICFALYGDTSSGSDRIPKNMRSHFSEADRLTEVEFIFELRGERYRIIRVPEQERPRKSGSGITVQAPEAVLYKYVDTGEKLIETSYKKVTDKIKTLIGFESNQFRQVIMLPQGEFRKLLTAETKDRQEILEKMFHTQVYRTIEETLKFNARRLEDEIRHIKNNQEYLLKRSGCENAQQLISIIMQDEALLKDIKDVIVEREKKLKGVSDALSKARQDKMKLEEKKKLENDLGQLLSMEEYIKKRNEELLLARKALALKEAEKLVKMLKEDRARLDLEMKSIKENVAASKERLLAAREAYIKEENRKEEREKAQKEIVELESYIGKVEQLDVLREDTIKLEREYQGVFQLKNNQSNAIKSSEREIEATDLELQDINLSKNKLVELLAQYKEEKLLYEKRLKLQELEKRYTEAEKECELGEKAFNKAKEAFEKAKREHLEMQEKRNRGQAGILAEGLEEGKPCPVCGAIHHIDIAKKEEGMPSEGELKLKERQVSALEEERDGKKAVIDKIVLQKLNIENQLKDITNELGDVGKNSPLEMRQGLEEKSASMKGLKSKVDKLEIVKNTLLQKKNGLLELKKRYEESEAIVNEKSQQYQQMRGSLKLLEESVPLELQSKTTLVKRIASINTSFEKMKKALENSKVLQERAEKEHMALVTRAEGLEKSIAEISQKYESHRQHFVLRLREAGFPSFEAYVSARENEGKMAAIESEIKSYGERLHLVEERLKQLSVEVKDVVQADIQSMEKMVQEAQMYRDEAVKEQISISGKITENKKTLEEINELEQKSGKKMEEYRVIGDISEVANGNNSYRLTLERFVLGSLLDDIALAATERLKLMSRGRYYLSRTMDVGRKNGKAGLDLQVFDNYTGMERQVSTLSGGESFLASLSLALGLADVVQSYSGGVSLDTMFIDEGFGTLDPEALDFALKTLIDLQKGGRLVGIISHVPELKERMDARLEIIKTDRGSKAKFCVL